MIRFCPHCERAMLLLDQADAVVEAAETDDRCNRDSQPNQNSLRLAYLFVLVFFDSIREAVKHGNLLGLPNIGGCQTDSRPLLIRFQEKN